MRPFVVYKCVREFPISRKCHDYFKFFQRQDKFFDSLIITEKNLKNETAISFCQTVQRERERERERERDHIRVKAVLNKH